jgi:hypothetical protein
MSEPDFYLASTEGYNLEEPRRCWRVKRLATTNRNDFLLARIDPPIVGQAYGLGGRDIDVVVFATRLKGESLFPVNEWPVSVYVVRPLIGDPQLRDQLRQDEFELIAWAELYQTEESARLRGRKKGG